MNQFELYCMVFFVLDAEWDETHSPELGEFLSNANPFLFDDIGSAIPEVYDDFCKTVAGNTPIEKSYETALAYVHSLKLNCVSEAFAKLDRSVWDEAVRDYLSSEHKGA